MTAHHDKLRAAADEPAAQDLIDAIENLDDLAHRLQEKVIRYERELGDLDEEIAALKAALERIINIEKAPDDDDDEYGFHSCQIAGYNDGLEVCQAIARTARDAMEGGDG